MLLYIAITQAATNWLSNPLLQRIHITMPVLGNNRELQVASHKWEAVISLQISSKDIR